MNKEEIFIEKVEAKGFEKCGCGGDVEIYKRTDTYADGGRCSVYYGGCCFGHCMGYYQRNDDFYSIEALRIWWNTGGRFNWKKK